MVITSTSCKLLVCLFMYMHVVNSGRTRSGTGEDVVFRYMEDLTNDFNLLKAQYANVLSEMNTLRTGLARQSQILATVVFQSDKIEIDAQLERQTEKIDELQAAFSVQEGTIKGLVDQENLRKQRHQGNNNIAVATDPSSYLLERETRRKVEKRNRARDNSNIATGTNTVSFSATRKKPLLGEIYAQRITFDHTFVNEEEDFDADGGVFTCSVPGVYYFSFTMRSYDNNYIGVILMKDDERQVSMATDADDRSLMQTQSVALSLEIGETVWLRLSPSRTSPVLHTHGVYSDGYAIYGNHFNYITFNGFLISPK